MQTFNDLIKNPFITSSKLLYYDEQSDSTIELNDKNIFNYYSVVFLLIKKNNILIPYEFYSPTISKNKLENILSNLILFKTSINILLNKNHFNNILILSQEELNRYNIFNYKLDNKNIVLPILNINYDNIFNYIEQYNLNNYNIKNLYNILLVNEYYSVSINNDIFLTNYINNLDELLYWTIDTNCKINLTNIFELRNFIIQPIRMIDRDLAIIITDIQKI